MGSAAVFTAPGGYWEGIGAPDPSGATFALRTRPRNGRTLTVRRAGASKLLFGTDGPWLHPGLELAKIRLLRLPADQEARVLGSNALCLLGRSSAARRLQAVAAEG